MTEEEFDDELRRSAFAVAYRMLIKPATSC
jgi:hypothetical protein